MAGVSYSPPWWVSLLHRLPHLSLRWELTAADFRPHDAEYQQCGFFADKRVAEKMFSAEFVFLALMPFSMCRRVEGVKKEVQARRAKESFALQQPDMFKK
ncbi:hypothetical protein IHE44_0004160 [Lamprotornis superbus]|uniref:Uncharacterized protein n=1 Tax=Lamprotornis superbus TaxID=245042 RepID=A0A835NNC9_9PASS|nr:hypothetical protein IHE44_0004160 [Lamprotornis superbus]